ncbi:MAG: hypothetical protein V4787_02185 [Pseudomonadota bacterium]
MKLQQIVESARPSDWRDLATHRLSVMLHSAAALEERLEHVAVQTASQLALLEMVRLNTMESLQQVADVAKTVTGLVAAGRDEIRDDGVRAAGEVAGRINYLTDQMSRELHRDHAAALDELESKRSTMTQAAEFLEKSLGSVQLARRQLQIERAEAAHDYRRFQSARDAARPWWRQLLRRAGVTATSP